MLPAARCVLYCPFQYNGQIRHRGSYRQGEARSVLKLAVPSRTKPRASPGLVLLSASPYREPGEAYPPPRRPGHSEVVSTIVAGPRLPLDSPSSRARVRGICAVLELPQTHVLRSEVSVCGCKGT